MDVGLFPWGTWFSWVQLLPREVKVDFCWIMRDYTQGDFFSWWCYTEAAPCDAIWPCDLLSSGASQQEGETSGKGGRSTSVIGSEVALFVGAASGSVIFIIIIVTLVVVLLKYRQRHHKHPPQHTVTMSLRSLATPKRGNGAHSNGSELSDIIIPLRTADSIFCPHYEKVSGDYGHPVYIVQEIAPQSPTNIYYKVWAPPDRMFDF